MSNQKTATALAGALLFDAGLRAVGRGGRRRLKHRVASQQWQVHHRASQLGFLGAGLVGGAAIAAAMLKERREARQRDADTPPATGTAAPRAAPAPSAVAAPRA